GPAQLGRNDDQLVVAFAQGVEIEVRIDFGAPLEAAEYRLAVAQTHGRVARRAVIIEKQRARIDERREHRRARERRAVVEEAALPAQH
nr:hypothetical protein [Tanacetum cinerariifolium]